MFSFIKKKNKTLVEEFTVELINGFDENAYLGANPDVKKGIQNGDFRSVKHHLETFGIDEIEQGLRKFHKDYAPFNEKEYFERYVDILNEIEVKYSSAFEYFCVVGYKEMMKNKTIISTQDSHEYYVLKKEKRLNWEEYKISYKTEDPILHYIKHWNELRPVFGVFFDTEWYLATYPDIKKLKINPLVHFLEKGLNENRLGVSSTSKVLMEKNKDMLFLNEKQQYLFEIIHSFGIDWSSYFIDNEIESSKITNPIIHYIMFCEELEPVITNVFDTELYNLMYEDLKNSDINPLVHYMNHGRNEGRIGWLDIDSYVSKGAVEHKKDIETLVIVTHESSATGAPLVSLNLSQILCQKFNVINITLRKKALHSDFLENCEYLIECINEDVIATKIFENFLLKRDILGVICNSVETFPILKAASRMGLPTISLVHEFSEYTLPRGKMSDTVLYADRVIVPAAIIEASLLEEFKDIYGEAEIPNNIVTLPQGKLPNIPENSGKNESRLEIFKKLDIEDDKNVKIIVGAGYVQIRKGVDLFLSMAKQVKERYKGKCKFIWVGAGYDVTDDLNYSVWIKKQFEMLKDDNDVIFMAHQRNLDVILELADVFALTSRLDPFPNVVIDAMEKDVHVSCFENSTGCADFLLKHKANGSVVDYLDTSKMSDAIVHYLNKKSRSKISNKKIIKEKLNFDTYLNDIVSLCKDVKNINTTNEMIKDRLLDEKLFNADFYHKGEDEITSCRTYVKCGKKGIHHYNPKVGFSEKYWINHYGKGEKSQVALYEAYQNKESLMTHDVIDINNISLEPYDKKFAIHLHLYYIDLAEEFSDYFSQLDGDFDIFITMVEMEKEEHVKKIFENCGVSKIYIIQVDNIGRDISPFFNAIKDEILQNDYEVVGHFHSKKSLEISEKMGDSWRKFIMESLVSNEVLSIFNDESVGLVFPEDRHCVDFSANKPYADELCDAMGVTLIDHANIYPLGTMFWARVDALMPLFKLDFALYVQEEPLPYDGSYLHAVERLLPHVSTQQGYQFMTVYDQGITW